MDVLARATMKDAANCETQCELQNSVNHQISERKWHLGDILLGTSVSVSLKSQFSAFLGSLLQFGWSPLGAVWLGVMSVEYSMSPWIMNTAEKLLVPLLLEAQVYCWVVSMTSLRYGGFFIEDKVSLMLSIDFNTAMEFRFHCCSARFRRCCFVSGVCPIYLSDLKSGEVTRWT